MSLFEELKRRNVFRIAIAYAILAWLVAQVAELFLEAFSAPDWVLKTILLLLVLGFPFAVFFAWAFELTPEGLKRESEVDRSHSITTQTGRKLDRTIIVVLVLALGYFAWDKFYAGPQQAGPAQETTAAAGEAASPAAPAKPALPTDRSIAVLPFENRSGREDDEYFTSGIHDDLLTQLAQISSLRVISRTSVEQFRDTKLSIHDIAKALNVATVMEGGVQRSGDQVRINLQLIDAATDTHLWAQTYDRELTANNVFAIQSEIASAVTQAMRATLTPDEQQRIQSVPTENMAALESYFKGRAEMDQRTVPSIESAQMRFEEARRLDPGFALAWASEAEAIQLLSDGPGSYGETPEEDAIKQGLPLIQRAYELAPDNPQVLAVYGLLERARFNVDAALDYYRRSLAIQPGNGEVLNWQQLSQRSKGDYRGALQTMNEMVEADPMSMIALYNATINFVNTPYDNPARIEQLQARLESLSPGFGAYAMANVNEFRGKLVEAAREYYRSIDLDPGRSAARGDLARLLANLGLPGEAMQVDPQRDELDDAIAHFDRERVVRLARERYAKAPELRRNKLHLFFALAYAAEDPEAAMQAGNEVWEAYKNIGVDAPGLTLTLAWNASEAEYPAESASFRAIAADSLRARIEAGMDDANLHGDQAALARIDGRFDDAIRELGLAMDKGYRDPYLAEDPMFRPLADQPGFQALLSRMRDTIETERSQVVNMLCGPDKAFPDWQPAPETCALYQAAGA